MLKVKYILLYFLLIGTTVFAQGPFAPAADSMGTTAIYKDSNIVYSWVNNCTITRGRQDIANQSGPLASVGDETMVFGKANLGVVSLGDGGTAVIELVNPISNHNGYDFAIFENGFYDMANGGYFLELAFVEVSSDGQNFERFPTQSLSPTDVQTGSFGVTDPTEIDGLAGKYKGFYGTPFDLSQLDQIFGLDITKITHIKIIDVVGSINPIYASYDDSAGVINDPYPTGFPSGGFDLDAIALIDSSLVTGMNEVHETQFQVYPNPVQSILYFTGKEQINEVRIYDISGNLILSSSHTLNQIEVSELSVGVYFIQIQTQNGISVNKFIKE